MTLASNLIPDLPNQKGGLSDKMLVLPFKVSFLGREETGLKDRLMEELEGIAAWAVEGARQLVACDDESERWPVPEKAVGVRENYALMNNVFDAFLKARFIQREDGRCSNEIIKREWKLYLKQTGTKLARPISMNHVVSRLVSESTWPLTQVQMGSGDERGMRGVQGMVLAKEAKDDV